MKKLLGNKKFILILGVISLLALILLVAGLSAVQFKPGTPFSYASTSDESEPGQMLYINPLLWIGVPLLILLIVIYILLPPEQRKKFLWMLVRLALLGIVLFFILSRMSYMPPVSAPTADAGGVIITPLAEPSSTPYPEVTPSVFVEPQVSPWLSYFIAFIFLLVGGGIWVWLALRKRREEAPLEELAGIVEETLEELEAGKDWGDTVLNCYYRMNAAVEKWRYIRRRAGMTPAEFAGYLVSAGLPQDAVRGLTEVFERVRYGGRKASRTDIQQATDCLNAILDYCRNA